MPYAKLKAELLAAREMRDAALRNALCNNRRTVLQLSLNLPGPDKQPAGARALFHWGEEQLCAKLPSLEKLTENDDFLGPWALYANNSPAAHIKQQALKVEEAHPAGRLLDIDVYDVNGTICDRKQMDLPQRRCLLCDEAARDCILLKRHRAEQLKAIIDELLTPFRT